MAVTWDEAVLGVLIRRGAVMSLTEIYESLEHHPLVTNHHKENWGGQPNYHHWIRSAISRLKKQGKIRHVGRSLYSAF